MEEEWLCEVCDKEALHKFCGREETWYACDEHYDDVDEMYEEEKEWYWD